MFSIAVGNSSPTRWAGGAACPSGNVYPFAFNQMTLLIGGVSYATNAQPYPPTDDRYVMPADDTYDPATVLPVTFMFGYNRPTGPVTGGWYAISGEVASSGGCQLRLERPFEGGITLPFFYGTFYGTPGYGQINLSLQAA
jgi:hypothetical protein